MNLVDFKELSIQSIELKELYANGTLIWQSARLPSEYQEVEFIYAADGAYINTGWVPSEGSTFNLIFYNYGNKPYPFGAGSSPRLAISKGSMASMQIYNTSNGTGGIYNFVPVMWERLNLETYSTNTTESYVKLNGEIVRNNTSQNVNFNSALPMFLGAWSYSASSTRLGAAWIYYAKANVKGTDIFELIPCYRKNDGVVGMYDMISKEFFTNAGTGDIVAGPEIGARKIVANLLTTALTPNDLTAVFDGKGYKNGYRASDTEPFYAAQESFFCTGLMPLAPHKTFYIKGCTLDKYTRVGLMRESGGFVKTDTLSDWVTGLTMTQLGEDYYSISIAPSYVSALGAPYYFYFSASGTGDNVIVSHTPIINDPIVNLMLTSLDTDGEGIYNNIGYKNGVYISSTGENTPSTDGIDATTVATGFIPYSFETLYIKGATINVGTSHCRAQYITADFKSKYQFAVGSMAWADHITIETLGTDYYKLTPKHTFDGIAYIRFSLIGQGEGLIISMKAIT